MANQIPFSGASNAAGAYILPTEQGDILANGVLQESGFLQVVGDRRATSQRKAQFGIWLGTPTAAVVGEGAVKPVTGGEFGQTVLNIKKIASIVMFTDEMREDVATGDLDVLVDSGVRDAIADVIDINGTGKDSGTDITTAFDSALRATSQSVEITVAADGLAKAVSSAMGVLEANGYGQNPASFGLLLGTGVQQHIRDARAAVETTSPIYGPGRDPTYGIQTAYSTNLNTFGEAAGANKVVGFLVYKPNLHVRLRKDVTLAVSSEATVYDGATNRNMFQEDLTAVRYETRLGFMVHDINRAVVKLTNAV